MDKKEQNVIRGAIFLVIYLIVQCVFAQRTSNMEIIGEENFRRFIGTNMLIHPIDNPESVKYSGYYIKLSIKDELIVGISFSENVPISIPRRLAVTFKDLNEKISLKDYRFLDVELIIIPVLLHWVEIEEELSSLDNALSYIIPDKINCKFVYILDPFVHNLYIPRK